MEEDVGYSPNEIELQQADEVIIFQSQLAGQDFIIILQPDHCRGKFFPGRWIKDIKSQILDAEIGERHPGLKSLREYSDD